MEHTRPGKPPPQVRERLAFSIPGRRNVGDRLKPPTLRKKKPVGGKTHALGIFTEFRGLAGTPSASRGLAVKTTTYGRPTLRSGEWAGTHQRRAIPRGRASFFPRNTEGNGAEGIRASTKGWKTNGLNPLGGNGTFPRGPFLLEKAGFGKLFSFFFGGAKGDD